MIYSYGYERTSTKTQKLDRQDVAIKGYRKSIPEENIFREQLTGKNFERAEYQRMKIILEHVVKTVQPTDIVEVIFEELDRLGRNAEGIKKELEWYKEHNICVRILEIPTTLIEFKNAENKWVLELVSQILIEVYATMAEQELEKRAKRQREGIDVALSKGVKFGRKPIVVESEQFKMVYDRWKCGLITARTAMHELGLKSNTFYRRVKDYEDSKNESNNHK